MASQSIALYAFDKTTNSPKTGDAANISAYVAKDHGSMSAAINTVTEWHSTKNPGWYILALAQAETNCDELMVSAVSTTSSVLLVGRPVTTLPPNLTSLAVDGSGRIDIGKALGAAVTLDANNVLNVSTKYVGGTLQTAGDIFSKVTGLTFTVANQVDVNVKDWAGAAVASAAAGIPKVDIDTIKTNPVVNAGTITFPTNATLASTTNLTAGTITTVTTVTNQLTAAQIATGVWTDTVAGDFTTALSVGKSVMNGVSLGTGLTVAAVSGAVGSVTGAVGSVAGLTASNLDATISSRLASATYVSPTTALTESYSALHAAPTGAQLLFEIRSLVQEVAVASTTLTAKKVDGSTTAMTFTLNSSSAPTSITRAS